MNMELWHDTLVYLDNTPPHTSILHGEPFYESDTWYVTSHTPISLEAEDEGCGVKETYYRINGDSWLVYTSSFYLSPDGSYLVEFYSLDWLDNTEDVQDKLIKVDNTPPVTEIRIGSPSYSYGDSVIVTSQTPESIISHDPLAGGVACGVGSLYVSYSSLTDTGFIQVPSSLYVLHLLGQDGVYRVLFHAVDHLGNTEPEHEVSLILDNTPPSISIWSPPDSSWVNQLIVVMGEAKDVHIQGWELSYGEGISPSAWEVIGTGTTDTAGVLGEWDTRGLSGVYTLRLRAWDVVGNEAEVRHIISCGEPELLFEITGFNKPDGVYLGRFIYVADRNNKRVAVFDEFGNYLWEIDKLLMPSDVYVKDRIYTTLFWGPHHPALLAYTLMGDSLLLAIDSLNHPKGVEVYPDSFYVVVADRNWDRVVFFDSLGGYLFEIDSVSKPEGIGVDDSGYVYTCENTDTLSRVVKFNLSGDRVLEWGNYRRLSDVDVDRAYRVWVAERNGNRILCFDRFGQLLLAFDDGFNKPEGVGIGRKRLAVADRNNDRVCVYGLMISPALSALKGLAEPDEVRIEDVLVYPNPFWAGEEEVKIRVKLTGMAQVRLRVYTVTGRFIYEDEQVISGEGEFIWDGRSLSGKVLRRGVYVIMVETEDDRRIVKLAIY
ncbi:hypothetical protein DRO29_02555 [Candidatus Bathyarchaeota archaeon]|nr:MAG: hypothetical protein DRO29_02555 [Candidatus Bathyarchaeota archaeon]